MSPISLWSGPRTKTERGQAREARSGRSGRLASGEHLWQEARGQGICLLSVAAVSCNENPVGVAVNPYAHIREGIVSDPTTHPPPRARWIDILVLKVFQFVPPCGRNQLPDRFRVCVEAEVVLGSIATREKIASLLKEVNISRPVCDICRNGLSQKPTRPGLRRGGVVCHVGPICSHGES